MQDIKTIAKKLGLDITVKGNLEIGSHDCGKWSPPGGRVSKAQVTYYILANGDYRVVVDDRYGSNQGRIEWHGGDTIRMDAADLDEAIQLAKDHIESLEDSADLMRAWRIAAAEARTNLRNANR